MLVFIAKRFLWMIPSLFAVSFLAFVLIQLPPGDYVTTYIATLAASNEIVDQNTAAQLRERFGLGDPMLIQYFKWIWGILTRGDFGISFEWQQPVSDLIWERMALTLVLALSTLIATWAIALPIGVYSAVRKYSIGDYFFTAFTFFGLAVPSFLLALVLMYVAAVEFGQDVGGLFSPEYENASWSFAKMVDLFSHLWLPVIILAVSSTASLIRVMRANMLDELPKPYVTTARAKGLSEFRLLMKYPLMIALNPFISTIAWLLPNLISGSVVVAIVLNLPTAAPLLLQALMAQDMYLAGAFVLLICALTLIGSLISDILLALVDPRIRLE
ncbi:ABC transporter permease (plasmid) [Rhizobium leguminosarum]|jgi:peptide/nickel transport system permease protein|uniref:ABC transporter permease n=3 Tax=Rhizobium TaxID=379 RepID=A0A1B8R5Y4_RHILT|nr:MULTISPECIES: ABC transporter permease [Rhizobium]MDH6660254.1 peptide/nickel transport system permease protein [Rhizobium sophorae]AOO93004.1 ABC transporter permease [Rhizobium leguminosarum bv. trifolii]ASS58540.1 ABC transporter permease [Rhizobium leguminosarum bv. viciae]AVC46258.1 binding-protein-dependent transport system inner membrane component family protein [Rhizobium leguminosarum bv. viciae]AXA42626.1 Binding-protein-dependent transport system inner membrane component family p